MAEEQSSSTSPRPLRWWPAALILVLAAVRLAVLWLGPADQLQDRVVPTIFTVGVTVIALVLWLLFFSALPWRSRGKALLALALAGGLFLTLFRFESFSGDLLPIFAFRFAGDAELEEANRRANAPTAISETDYPQFLGQRRDGVVNTVSLDRDWQTNPPEELWRRSVGPSWAAFAVVGNAAVTLEQRGEHEAATRYDVESGEPVWVTQLTEYRFESPIGGNGPRATPTLYDGRVYTYSSNGVLSCLDLADGSILWQRNTQEETGATIPDWQMSGSPLVVEDLGLLVVAPGGPEGSVVAYDIATGEPRWSAGDDSASYASPNLLEIAGQRQIVSRNQNSITGHDPETGTILWTQEWPGGNPNVAQPMPIGDDKLLISSGYGIGASLFRLVPEGEGFTVEEVWANLNLKAKFANPVFHNDRVYGLDDGILVCLDPETGERCWKRGRYGHGQLMLVGDLLVLIAEDGDLYLIEASPESLNEVAVLEGALDGKSWNNPALAEDLLLLRNAETAVAYRLPTAG